MPNLSPAVWHIERFCSAGSRYYKWQAAVQTCTALLPAKFSAVEFSGRKSQARFMICRFVDRQMQHQTSFTVSVSIFLNNAILVNWCIYFCNALPALWKTLSVLLVQGFGSPNVCRDHFHSMFLLFSSSLTARGWLGITSVQCQCPLSSCAHTRCI